MNASSFGFQLVWRDPIAGAALRLLAAVYPAAPSSSAWWWDAARRYGASVPLGFSACVRIGSAFAEGRAS